MAWYLPDRYPVFWEEVRRRMVGRLLRLSQPPRTPGNANAPWLRQALFIPVLILVLLKLLLLLTPFFSHNANAYDADFWNGLLTAQYFLTILLAPVLALSIFTTERERGSLDFLFLLPISTDSLTLQKFASACLLPLSVILFLLPYSLLIAVLGHLSPRAVLLGYVSLLAHGAFYVAFALLISSLARNTRTAAILAYVGIFVFEYLLPHWFDDNSLPLFGMVASKVAGSYIGPLAVFLPPFFYLFFATLALWICATVLKRQRVSRGERGVTYPRAGRVARQHSSMRWYLPDTHPLLWDDLRRRLREGRAFGMLLGFVLVLCVILVVVCMLTAPDADPQAWPRLGRNLFLSTMIAQAVMVCLLSPALTATTFSSERESRRIDFLFLTGLTTRELVYGKLLSALAVLLLALICGAPVLAIIAATFGGISPWELAFGYAIVVFCGLFGATSALFSSCRTKDSSKAFMQGYLTAYGFGAMLAIVLAAGDLMTMSIASPMMLFGVIIGFIIIFTNLKTAVADLEKERRQSVEEALALDGTPEEGFLLML